MKFTLHVLVSIGSTSYAFDLTEGIAINATDSENPMQIGKGPSKVTEMPDYYFDGSYTVSDEDYWLNATEKFNATENPIANTLSTKTEKITGSADLNVVKWGNRGVEMG